MLDGIINVYKEQGYTSHDVVAKMRGILRLKKIGHTGTLDPDAVGVLPVCIGKGTRLVDMITDRDKTYEAVLKLGITTDTQDISGTILKTCDVIMDKPRIEAAIQSFVGEYMQLPPMYSAIKIDGKRLYELARQGKEVERERRRVIIKDIRITDWSEAEQEIALAVDCGKGTYIRTLLHDIGEALGCGGTMISLKRTAVGSFLIKDSLKLSEIETLFHDNRLEQYIQPIEDNFKHYDSIHIARDNHKLIYNGNAFRSEHSSDSNKPISTEFVRVYDADSVFIGIYQYMEDDNLFKPVKMFLH